MFDFDAALKQVQEEREAKTAADAAREQKIHQRITDLHIPLQKFIDKEELAATTTRKDNLLTITKKHGGQIRISANDAGTYQAETVGAVYTGYAVDGRDLKDNEITKILAAWLTAQPDSKR